MLFTKPLCQTDIVRVEQSEALKKPLRALQNNSRGTDCRNFAVASTAANSCWSRCCNGVQLQRYREEFSDP